MKLCNYILCSYCSFEAALVSSYRPYIVTFPLSRRVSEILPLLYSSTPLLPNPPLVSPKFPHVPLGVGLWRLGYEEGRCWANSMQLVFKISNLCAPDKPKSQTDRRTDGWTDDMQSQYRSLHYSASCSKNAAGDYFYLTHPVDTP